MNKVHHTPSDLIKGTGNWSVTSLRPHCAMLGTWGARVNKNTVKFSTIFNVAFSLLSVYLGAIDLSPFFIAPIKLLLASLLFVFLMFP